jgi:outer membrane cobalamin receptor
MKGLSGIIFLVFLSQGVFGQSLADTVRIREVQVFGQRKPEETGMKITRPDSLAMISSITAHLHELLSQNTPVFIKTYGRGSVATASFRGTSSSHTQLLWNGMTLNSPLRGSADLSLLPVLFIDDAWLLHGGSSLSENSGALGGSIHLANKADWSRTNNLVILAGLGSFNSGTWLARMQAGKQKFRSVTRLMYDHSENNFPFYNVGVLPSRTDTLGNADYRKWAALQEFYLRFGVENQAALRIWFQQSDRNLPQLMSYEGSLRKETQEDGQLRTQIEVKNYSSAIKYHYSSGLNHTRLNYFRSAAGHEYVNDDARSSESSLYNRVKLNTSFNSKLHISGLVEINHHLVDVKNPVRQIGYRKSRLEGGAMVHFQYRPGATWGVFALMRSEGYDGEFVPFIPSAGAEISLSDTYPVLIKVNAARNYHKPTLNDLYWIPGGNPDLKAEDGLMADFSVSTDSRVSGRWQQEVTLFYSLIDNWIIWQPSATGAWYWEAANVKEVFSRGVEYQFSSRMQFNRMKLQFSGNYAFTRSTNENAVRSADQSRGKQLIYIPKHTGNLHAAATAGTWTVRGDLGYTGRRYTQSSNEWSHYESVLNPFWITGASVEKLFVSGNWKISTQLKADNLFNVNYQQILWRPMPGRHYSITLAFRWNQ